MSRWLEFFANKAPLRWWIFALSTLLSLFITLITVSWLSWKGATKNPVDVLQGE
jgi:putative ABC transport system permease protein